MWQSCLPRNLPHQRGRQPQRSHPSWQSPHLWQGCVSRGNCCPLRLAPRCGRVIYLVTVPTLAKSHSPMGTTLAKTSSSEVADPRWPSNRPSLQCCSPGGCFSPYRTLPECEVPSLTYLPSSANLPSWRTCRPGQIFSTQCILALGEDTICGEGAFMVNLLPAANLPSCNKVAYFANVLPCCG